MSIASFNDVVDAFERAKRRARDDADYVMRWLKQTDAPENIVALQLRVLGTFGWPTHGRHCNCSACAREDWTQPHLAGCGMHGESCPRRYQPYGPVIAPTEANA